MDGKLFLFADLVFFCILKYQMFISLFSKSERFREGFRYFSHLMMEKKQELFFLFTVLFLKLYIKSSRKFSVINSVNRKRIEWYNLLFQDVRFIFFI